MFESSLNGLQLRAVAITDPGKRRSHNEDAYLVKSDIGLFVVADGMGGHQGGEVASHRVVEALGSVAAAELGLLCNTIDQQLEFVSQQLANPSAPELQNVTTPGTTVAALVVCSTEGQLLWIGDSRIYRLRDGSLQQLTRDHSLVAELLASGQISEQEARVHPRRNVITRAIGAGARYQLDRRSIDIQPGDRYLLCTDGVYNGLQDDELKALISENSVESGCRKIKDRVLQGPALDNLTAILVECG